MLRRTFVPLLRLVGLAAAATLVAACGLVAVRGTQTWTTASSGVDGREAVVNVVDRSGKVADIEFDPFDAAAGAEAPPDAAPDRDVAMVPGQPDALDISWWGDTCDTWTDLTVDGVGAGLAVKIAITTDNGDRCDASRKRIRLKLHQPVPPAMVAVSR